jgi:hypothetical protein
MPACARDSPVSPDRNQPNSIFDEAAAAARHAPHRGMPRMTVKANVMALPRSWNSSSSNSKSWNALVKSSRSFRIGPCPRHQGEGPLTLLPQTVRTFGLRDDRCQHCEACHPQLVHAPTDYGHECVQEAMETDAESRCVGKARGVLL